VSGKTPNPTIEVLGVHCENELCHEMAKAAMRIIAFKVWFFIG
jgi:hypothetical protein